MVVIWIITMIILGLFWQRGTWWKKRHDFDHAMAARFARLIQTCEPTEATFILLEQMHASDPEFAAEMASFDV